MTSRLIPRWRIRLFGRFHTLRDWLMCRCRVCGGRDAVISYDPRGLWAYFFRKTWCPEHCPEHDYENEPGMGPCCIRCSQRHPEPWDWYDHG